MRLDATRSDFYRTHKTGPEGMAYRQDLANRMIDGIIAENQKYIEDKCQLSPYCQCSGCQADSADTFFSQKYD